VLSGVGTMMEVESPKRRPYILAACSFRVRGGNLALCSKPPRKCFSSNSSQRPASHDRWSHIRIFEEVLVHIEGLPNSCLLSLVQFIHWDRLPETLKGRGGDKEVPIESQLFLKKNQNRRQSRGDVCLYENYNLDH